MADVSSALGGLNVLDLSNTLTGTQISQVHCEFGADVVHVEPPDGSDLRTQPAWPSWGRGKRSVVLDLKDAHHAATPTMGAGSGLAYRNVAGPANVPSSPELTLDEVKRNPMRLSSAAMAVGHADGFSALGVATALVLGVLAKKRGTPGQAMMTSMLSTMAHTLSEDMVEYENRPPVQLPNADLYGLSARYRLYRAADGWVFLAAPSESEGVALAGALGLDDRLDDDHLAAVLEERFATKTAEEWEGELAVHDVTSVEVAKGLIEEVVMLSGGMAAEMDIVTQATHPVVGDYARLTPLVRYERLGGVTGSAPLCGQDTDAVLAELGYGPEDIASLRHQHLIG